MSDALIAQLPAILIASATLVTSLGGVVLSLLNRTKLTAVEKKVDGGMTNLQDALARVAVTATAQPAKREHRATDQQREPG